MTDEGERTPTDPVPTDPVPTDPVPTDPVPTDRPADGGDAAEAQVRALLGTLRSEEPMPTDVAARLDARLAELVAERKAGVPVLHEGRHDEPGVVDSRRPRRRWLGPLVGAAAAVVVGGVALTQVPGGIGLGGSDSFDSAVSAEHRESTSDDERPYGAENDGADDRAGNHGDGAGSEPGVMEGLGGAGLPAVSSESLLEDLVALRDRQVQEPGTAPGTDPSTSPSTSPGAGVARCAPPSPIPAGATATPVSWDGRPGWVVLSPETAEGQAAELWSCAELAAGSEGPSTQVVLPLPPATR